MCEVWHQDALQKLSAYPSDQLKKPLKVVFDGEEGVDEGGVQKAWSADICKYIKKHRLQPIRVRRSV